MRDRRLHKVYAGILVRSAQSSGDKPSLAISPSGKDVYVAFNDYFASYVAASHDYGATFLEPVRTTHGDDRYVYTYGSTVAPDGTVYFAQVGETGTPSHPDRLVGPQYIMVLRCTPAMICTSTSIATSQAPYPCSVSQCYPDFFASQSSIAANRSGMLMLAYNLNNTDRASQNLYVRTSRDGVEWSPARILNSQGDSNFPVVVSGPAAGDFRLAWQDNRNGSGASDIGGWNLWYRHTSDGGETWATNVRLSNLESGAPYKNAAGYAFPHGDYSGLAVDADGRSFLIWGEADGSSIYCCGSSWFTRGR